MNMPVRELEILLHVLGITQSWLAETGGPQDAFSQAGQTKSHDKFVPQKLKHR